MRPSLGRRLGMGAVRSRRKRLQDGSWCSVNLHICRGRAPSASISSITMASARSSWQLTGISESPASSSWKSAPRPAMSCASSRELGSSGPASVGRRARHQQWNLFYVPALQGVTRRQDRPRQNEPCMVQALTEMFVASRRYRHVNHRSVG